MADYHIASGGIEKGKLYVVAGERSVIYTGVTYNTGDKFRGTGTNTYAFSGSGTQLVYEVVEVFSLSFGLERSGVDLPVFPENIDIKGISLGMETNAVDRLYPDILVVYGLSIGLEHSPLFVDSVIERRL